MNSNGLTGKTGHDEIAVLLPWYVNGSLTVDEQIRVEEHVRHCLPCRRELALERRTLETFQTVSPVDQSAHAAFERLQHRIAGRVRQRQRSCFRDLALGLRRRFAAAADRPWPGLRPVLIALPLVAAVFGLVWVNVEPDGIHLTGGAGPGGTAPEASRYHTLSGPENVAARIDDIHVIFARGTGQARIAQILRPLNAGVVDGPNSAGAYTVRVSGVTDEHEREATIAALRDRPEVLFAEPAQPLAVPEPPEGAPQ